MVRFVRLTNRIFPYIGNDLVKLACAVPGMRWGYGVGHANLSPWVLRALAAVALACPAAGVAQTNPVEAATPPLIWQNVAAVRVLCLVVTDRGVERDRLTAGICDRVRELAAAGAPHPVSIIELGDPAVLASNSVTLLVHVTITPAE